MFFSFLGKFSMKILDFLLKLAYILDKFALEVFMVLSILLNFFGCSSDSHSQLFALIFSFLNHCQVLGLVLFQVVKYFKLLIQTNQHVERVLKLYVLFFECHLQIFVVFLLKHCLSEPMHCNFACKSFARASWSIA